MRAIQRLRILGLACLVAVFGSLVRAQEPAPAPADAATTANFSASQLEQLVAPIALYPDALIAQILMASTYPLEIVEAARWLEKNPKLEGKALEEALKDQDWDTNVKALCGFRDVVKRMNENLDWTQDLGDAFLAQRADLMDAAQRMRNTAYEAGNLKTTEQQVVTQQPDKIIVIQSADPEVVYVPTYSPQVVYVGWSYPSYYYPAMYAPYPYGYGAMAFTAGVFWGAALSGGCGWGWGGGDVDIDIDRNTNIENNLNRESNRSRDSARTREGQSGGKGKFQHNPEHRGGVNYRDQKTAQQFGGQGNSNRVTRDQARGYDRGGASASNRAAGGASASNRAAGGASASNRAAGGASASNRAAGGTSAASRAGGGTSASSRAAGGTSASQRSSASRGSSAWSGSRNSSFDRSSSSRGSMSRGGGYGGGGRGGGGRGGGGGRRR